MSLLNQNRVIRLYLITIALIGAFVFIVFVLANALTTRQNSTLVHDMQVRHFPIITVLIDLRQDTITLKKRFEDAIAYENDFLVMEAKQKSQLASDKLEKLEALLGEDDEDLEAISDALADYTNHATNLVYGLIRSPQELERLSFKAQRTNAAFDKLTDFVNRKLEVQRDHYKKQLIALDKNQRGSTLTATVIGMCLLAVLFGFTVFITRRIMSAVKRADNLKEVFLTTVSHELRTPLTGIYGTLNLLAGAKSESERNELIALGQTASRAMNKIVDDIILFAELMSGQNRIIYSEFRPKTVLDEVIKLTQAQCEEKNIIFQFNITDIKIRTDERKLSRTLGHVLENATKYTDHGHISLKIFESAHPESTQTYTSADDNTGPHKSILNILVEDTGPGITQDYLEHIFMPFEQGDNNWNREHQGMGLGLPMSYLMITSLEGELAIYNRGEISGVCVKISIPCTIIPEKMSPEKTSSEKMAPEKSDPKREREESVQTEAASDSSSTGSANHEQRMPNSKKPNSDRTQDQPRARQALIVEDNITNQIILKRILKNLNISAQLANNGAEAIELFDGNKFDVVFMDCQMPVMDGFEATEHIRARPESGCSIPIIAVTANTRDTDKARCFDVGMNDFLEKPINLKTIKQVLTKHVQSNG